MTSSQRTANAPSALTPAAYIGQLRRLLEEANALRKPWISQVGLLLQEAQTNASPAAVLAALAGRAGYQGYSQFSELRARVAAIEPPPAAGPCHVSVLAWLDKLIAASEILREIERTQDCERLREVQGLVAEARYDARRFTAEITELLSSLRRRNDARRAVARTRSHQARQRVRPTEATVDPISRSESVWSKVARLLGLSPAQAEAARPAA